MMANRDCLISRLEPSPMEPSAPSALFVGGTHADAGWLQFVVSPAAKKIRGIGTMIKTGDFEYWPDSPKLFTFAKVRS